MGTEPTLTVAVAFNGLGESGSGGYACGLVAQALGEEHVAIGWPLRVEGRKRFAASALLSATGEVLARCEVMLVEP